MKQPALLKFYKDLEKYAIIKDSQFVLNIPLVLLGELFEKAKEMERLQLTDAQSYAISNADMTNNRGYFDCDKWYDETYGSKGSDETKIDKL